MIASDVVTFTSCDGSITYTVRKAFIQKHPDYLQETPYVLNAQYQISEYLHNEHGPALITNGNGVEYYFSDGVQIVDPEKIRRLLHNQSFKDEMTGILGD